MFTFTTRGYEHNVFQKGYNKALAYIHKHIKWSRKIDYIQQTNPYKYSFEVGDGWFKIIALIPGCPKESVSVKYISDENLVKLEAKSEVENFKRNYEASYYVPSKFNLDEMQCSLKNGILTISIPHGVDVGVVVELGVLWGVLVS